MRILWLKADLLLPLDKGGKLRTWHLLRHLKRRHQITYLSYDEARDPNQGPHAELEGMRDVADELITIPRADPPKGSARFYADAGRHLFSRLPYAVGKYRSRAYASQVAALLRTHAFDLIVSDFLPPSVNLPSALPCPAVLFTHNVESEIWRRHVETRRGVVRLLYRSQHRRMLRCEARALRRFDGVLAVSDTDRDTFERLYPNAARRPIRVVPTGVDTEFFSPADDPPASRSLVFTGSMDWLPNEDAMMYFCRDILPAIRRAEPDVSLTIVGRAPTPAVQRLGREHGVAVTGRVDDVRPAVREAAVYIVPLRVGGGTRLKIFEAMAMGKAVVSTRIGAEGLPVRDGEHLVIADEPRHFAEAVVRLLRSPGRRQELGAAARTLVVQRYDWSHAAAVLEEALIEFAGAASATDRHQRVALAVGAR